MTFTVPSIFEPTPDPTMNGLLDILRDEASGTYVDWDGSPGGVLPPIGPADAWRCVAQRVDESPYDWYPLRDAAWDLWYLGAIAFDTLERMLAQLDAHHQFEWWLHASRWTRFRSWLGGNTAWCREDWLTEDRQPRVLLALWMAEECDDDPDLPRGPRGAPWGRTNG